MCKLEWVIGKNCILDINLKMLQHGLVMKMERFFKSVIIITISVLFYNVSVSQHGG